MYSQPTSIESIAPRWRVRIFLTALILSFLATIGLAISAIASGSLFASYNSTNVSNLSIQLEPGDSASLHITSSPGMPSGSAISSYSSNTGVASIGTAYEVAGVSGDATFSVSAVDSGNATLSFATAGWGSVNVDVYVGWPVTYDLNGGSGDVPATGYYYENDGGYSLLDDTGFSYEGYTFAGWNTQADGNGSTYYGGSVYNTAADVTLYAQWSINTYTVSFSTNGGTGTAPSSISFDVNNPANLPDSSGFYYDGYTFEGWSTTSGANMVDYYDTDSYSNLGDVTLYAVWSENTYYIDYYANGSPDSDYWEDFSVNSIPAGIDYNSFTRTGYTFLGWSTVSTDTAGDPTYAEGSSYSTLADLALYAIWSLDGYTVSFDVNGGTGSAPASVSFDVNNPAALPDSTGFSYAGYTFEGWSTMSGLGTTVDYYDTDTYSTLNNVTLYAVWSENTYYINYYGNGDDYADSDWESFTVTTAPAFIDYNSFTRTGYTFIGWSTNSADTAGDPTYLEGGTYSTLADLNLYAIWSLDVYTITLDLDNGTGTTPAAVTFDVNNAATLPDGTGFSRDGYQFEGWSTTPGTSSPDYLSGGSYSTLGDVTLYASWSVVTYYINYYGNGADSGTDYNESFSVLTGFETTDNSNFTRTGYTFMGWSTVSSDTYDDKAYYPGNSYNTYADLTLFAIWSLDTYTITFDISGGLGSAPSSVTFDVYNVANLPDGTGFYYDGFTFSGWSTTPGSNTVDYYDTDSYTTLGDVTLYAVWSEDTYYINYYGNGDDYAQSDYETFTATTGFATINNNIFDRTGYSFVGWSTNSSDVTGDASYDVGTTHSSFSDLTLYAIWSLNTYTVTFSTNGGSGSAPATVSFDVNTAADLPDSTGFYYAGYTFQGWSTSSGLSNAVEYYDYDSYSTLNDVTLYAVWSENTYYIYYIGQGAAEADYSESFSVSTGFPTIDNNFTNEGYTFVGYTSTDNDVADASFDAGLTYSTYADITLWAVWDRNTYVLTFNLDNGTGTTPGNISFDVQNPATLPDGSGFSRPGYTFEGWSTTSGTTTGEYAAGSSYSTLGNQTLYAAWDAIHYTIYYNGNGFDGGSVPSDGSYVPGTGSYTISNEGTLTKTGATFLGWSTNSADVSADVTYTPGSSYDSPSDLTLYAIWQDVTYTIAYDENGGSGLLPTGGNFTYCDVNAGSAAGLTYAGYTFSHWNTTSGDTGTSYNPGDALCETQNTTLYAIWSANSYDVNYYGNGDDGGSTAAGSYTTGGPSYTIASNGFTRNGYTFLGWSTNSSDVTGDASYDAGDSYSTPSHLNLYAIWSLDSYTISYFDYSNTGGSAPSGTNFDVLDGSYTILGQGSLERTGYSFVGWSDSSSDTSVEYYSGDSYDTLADLNLFAVWSANSYDVIYDGNGAEGGDTYPATYVTDEGSVFIAGNGFTRNGYTFLGWSTNSSDVTGDASYDVGDSYSTPANLYLYAIWSLDNYTISYDGNGNTDGSAPTGTNFNVLYGSYTILGEGSLVKAGYNFLGWSTNSSDTSPQYASGDSYDSLADLTLYAVWGGATYGIYYNANGAESGSYVNGTYTVDGPAYTIASNGFVRNGYSFIGWSTYSGDVSGDSTYDPGSSYDTAADLYLFAIWSANTYSIAYDPNGGSGSMTNGSYTMDSTPYTIASNSFTRGGYEFTGWADVSGDSYDVGESYDTPLDVILYAQWSALTYSISYNANGGSGSMSDGSYTTDGSPYVIEYNTFDREGYSFNSWRTLSGDVYYEGSTYEVPADLALYAYWLPYYYTVNYYANGGSGTVPSSQTFTYDVSDVTIASNTLSRDGYDFAGWNTEPDGSGDQYLAGSTYGDAGHLDLYAQWTAQPDDGGPAQTQPPVITSAPVICSPDGTVTLHGLRLNKLLRLEAGGKNLEILSKTQGSVTVKIPTDLAPGLYDVTGYYAEGTIVTKNAIQVEVELAVWTKRISNGQAKMYAKWPVGEGKIQFKVNGKEIAWIRAVDYADPKLFQAANVGYYLVRTVDLKAGKNALEIYQDGVRIWRAAYSK